MFNSTLIYRIRSWEPPAREDIESRLDKARFVECGATQLESVGWIAPRGEKQAFLMEGVGRQLILKLCIERKTVPSDVVKVQLEQRLEKIEAQTGRRPKGKEVKALKEEIVHGLLPRAFAKRSTAWVWIDPQAQLIVLGTASTKAADLIVSMLVELLGGGIQLMLLQTTTSPSTAMALWLQEREGPAGFSIDRECELKQPDSEKSLVRYARHTLDIDEVALHIQQGKLPTQLAMTWNSRVSFALSETMALKKIKLLDLALESHKTGAGGNDNDFDSNVALITGELSQLIADLVQALDGELSPDQPLALESDAAAQRPMALA